METLTETLELPETKRKLIDASVRLMRSKGFNATTVDEICEEAAVTKGAFFHYFRSKEDIGKAAIRRFGEERSEKYQKAAFQNLADPLDRVYGRLDFARELAGGNSGSTRGCLIGTFAQEISFTHPALRIVCQDLFLKSAKEFERDLEAAKSAHAPAATFDPKALSLLYISIYQGSTMMAKASENSAVLLDNIEQFRRYLQNLFCQGSSSGSAVPKSPNISQN